MKKFLSFLIIAAFMLFGSNFVFSMVQVGEEVAQRFETPHPYPGMKGVVWEQEIHWPKAGYIAIHFSEFNLAKGDYVEISSPDGRFYYTFSEKGKKVKHRNRTEDLSEFWATHIPGDKAIVRLVSKNKRSDHGFVIDKYARGYERGYIQAVMAGLEEEAMFEAVCNSDDKEWAKCYEGTTMYNESRAVCRLLIGGTSACTGWLLGSEGHIMTNNHCISTQSSASNTDYEFMAEGATCSTSCASWGACPGTVEASSGSLIQTDSALDYTLILLPTNITGTYGYMQLRDTLPSLDERIYIPQHPSAWGKQLAVLSDTDGPYAKIYSTNEAPCSGGPGDIGYYADTAGGSSGSPVLAYDDNLVVALHHCADCPNRGVPIPSIISDLGSNIPANAIGGGGPPQPPVANFSASPTTVEVGNNVQFTDLSTNTPTSWSWTFEGGTPSTSTAQNPLVTYNTIGTYNVTLTATNSAGSDTETKVDYITVQDIVIEYCTSSGNDQSYEYIAGVSVGDLTNNSGASGYSDFTYMTADLTAGSSVSVSLTPGFPGSSYTEYWRIWIDYNVDGDFEDSGEEVFSGSGSSTVTGSFTVPSGLEAVTRMRVSMSYSTYPPICGTFTYGEVEDYTVDISGGTPPPQYTLTTNTVGNGSITLNPPGGVYDEGTVVTLTAVPASGWQFDGWSGDLSGTANPTTITMNSNKNVTAAFSEVPVQYTLTVNTVGQGTVTLNPPGGTYDAGTVVTLTATPASGWQFDGWSGDLSGTANPTTITMNSNKNVTATFSEVPVTQYTLTVNTVGQGSVTLNPPGGVYNEGTVVTLTATPASGWQFDNWSGDLTGTANPTTITMNSNKTVTANFSEVGTTGTVGNDTVFGSTSTSANRRAMPFTMPENGTISSVTMYHEGGSGGLILGVYDGEGTPQNRLGVTPSTTINSSAGWQTINLSSPAYVAGGSTVWLAWVFQSNPGIAYQTGSPGRYQSSDTWSGGMPDPFGSGSQSSYLYSIYANYTPSAPPQYTLTVNTVGQGTVTLNPPGGTYDAGTVVTLTATPDSGWQFDNWSGDLSGSTNPTTITMNSNKTVTANFSEVGATGTVGITSVYSSTSTSGYRRAMPFTMPENGTITSVTMYHTGGSGGLILAVYDGEGTPQARLAVTPTTTVSGSTGWQTINLTSPAYVAAGSTVWLAWVYQSNPGIRYTTGSPGRYQSTQTWSGGMPDPFGSGSQTSYLYSIYATYNK